MPAALRLMIVEDENLLAQELADLVERHGHTIVGIAGSAEAAMNLSAIARPDLVLCDVSLSSSYDGVDAAQVMRERDGVQSLFVTALTDPSTRDRAQAAWPLGLLSKPVDPGVLAATLRGAASMLEERRRQLAWSRCR